MPPASGTSACSSSAIGSPKAPWSTWKSASEHARPFANVATVRSAEMPPVVLDMPPPARVVFQPYAGGASLFRLELEGDGGREDGRRRPGVSRLPGRLEQLRQASCAGAGPARQGAGAAADADVIVKGTTTS